MGIRKGWIGDGATNFIPLPHAIVSLEEALIMRDAVFAIEETAVDGAGSGTRGEDQLNFSCDVRRRW